MSTEFATGGGPTLEWIKSSYSSNEHGSDCVEVAADGGATHVRDSKRPDAARLGFRADVWAGFVAYVAAR